MAGGGVLGAGVFEGWVVGAGELVLISLVWRVWQLDKLLVGASVKNSCGKFASVGACGKWRVW